MIKMWKPFVVMAIVGYGFIAKAQVVVERSDSIESVKADTLRLVVDNAPEEEIIIDSLNSEITTTKSVRTLGSSFAKDSIYINDDDTIHLYDNSFDGLHMLDDQVEGYKVFINGENHTYTESNARLWLKMIKYLHANAGVRNIMFEYGYSFGYLVNEYLQTGDTSLFNSLDQFAYDEYSSVIEELKNFNDSLPSDQKLYFAAIDIERGIYPVAKMLDFILPDDSVSIPDSISLHVLSLKSLAEYNDFKLDEADNGVTSSGYTSGFNFRTGATLKLVYDNFKEHKEYYKQYLKDNYTLFEDIIINKYESREKWVEYESSNAIQEYIFREDYMHKQFLKEYDEHPGNWFGQFGRCHTTKTKQNNNSCEWFKFSSLAERIKNTDGDMFKDAVMTMAIVYDNDRNFGPDKVSTSELFDKYFEDMTQNSLSLLSLSGDSAINAAYGTDFDYLILSTYNQFGSSYNYLFDEEEEDERFKLTFGYGNQDFNLDRLNSQFLNQGSISTFSTSKAYWEIMLIGHKDKFSTSTSFGKLIKESVVLGPNSYELTGYYVKDIFYYPFFTDNAWIDFSPGLGFGYSNLSLNTTETNSNSQDLNNGFLGEVKNTKYVNDAFVFDIGAIIDINLKWLTFGYHGGYNLDVSNKRWKSNREHLNDSPWTSLSGLYGTVRIGVNF